MEQHSYYHYKRHETLGLIASIIFHLLLLLFFIYCSFDQHLLKEIFEKPSPVLTPTLHKTVAALKPRASSFGIPIHFTTPSSDDSNADKQDNMQEQENPHNFSSQTQTLQEYPQPKQEDEPAKQTTPIDSPEPYELKQEDLPTAHKATIIQKDKTEPRKEPLTCTPAQQPIHIPKAQTPKKQPAIYSKQSKNKVITFADLARGFLDNIKNEGRDSFKRDGDPTKRPDQEDLKKISYLQKIMWYMQNEWKIEQHKLHVPTFDDIAASILVTISKEGKVTSAKVVQSSGFTAYDEFIIGGIKRAAPYPPLPKHFDKAFFDIVLTIHYVQQRPWNVNLQSSTL